jgi:O-antigen biosynthesis protein WbqV
MDRSSPDTMATGMGAAAAEPAAGGAGRGARLAAWVRAHLPGRRGRHAILASLDAAAAVLAVGMALLLRFNLDVPSHVVRGFAFAVPVILLASIAVFHVSGLYQRAWRYMSINDVPVLLVAATASTCAWVAALMLLGHIAWLPASVPLISWLLLLAGLGVTRLARRAGLDYLRRFPEPGAKPQPAGSRLALVVGEGDQVELALRLLQANPMAGYVPVGVLDGQSGHLRMRVRGVPMMGGIEALEPAVMQLAAEGRRPSVLLITQPMDRLTGQTLVRFVAEAERLGLSVARLPAGIGALPEKGGRLELDFMDLASLLGRPPREGDATAIARFVAGQRVMVTGAGGTIGRELVLQLAKAGPSEIVLLDAGEFNLYAIDQELGETFPDLPRYPVLCSIRQRDNVMNVFAKFRPNLVFHAAALKHVPLVETNPCAGVMTNVIGTRNVADAAKKFGARAMVQVSTDKAVNPVGVMGATKRLGELYCQALDLEGLNAPVKTRFLTTRFGNVVGSSGSLIPLLQRQLSRRGPLTVTHPEIRRYFMTVNEAVLLILQGAALAMQADDHYGRIFVLDMGEPIRVMDIARRMIRLAGLQPEKDVAIRIIGLRPGEKLYEELFDSGEERLDSSLPGIFEAVPAARPLADLNMAFDRLAAAAVADDAVTVRTILPQIVDGSWRPNVDPLRDLLVVGWGQQPKVAEAAE